jgi:signal transduction histidine kinase
MRARFRVPMFVVAAGLLGLIALLATLQYRWLGQVSAAERERMKTNLASRAASFAQDFDREITRAYLTFQADTVQEGENAAARMATLHDRWQGSSRYPRLLKDVYLVPRAEAGPLKLQRYDPSTRFIEPVEWPEPLRPIRDQLTKPTEAVPSSTAGASGATLMIRSMPATVWESVPALVVPMPVVLLNALTLSTPLHGGRQEMRIAPSMAFTILTIDRDYVSAEMLPALAQQHFHATSEGTDYELAVVSTAAGDAKYSTDPQFTPPADAPADAGADLFQIRLQEFGAMASEVRRFRSFTSRVEKPGSSTELQITAGAPATGSFVVRETAPISVVLQHAGAPGADKAAIETAFAAATTRALASAPKWRLVVKHPSGSLETAVASVRRRNLLVSSGILGVLGVSIGFLVVSTRRAQDLARQQMEFVAAVSHELRTPLAVIRSAADNLADGVVHDDPQVRKYGDLVRGEGRRLTEMVEQILELAGIQSGQRGFGLAPVAVLPLLRQVVHASSTLIAEAGLEVEYDVPETLPPVLGDEPGLRRVFQNLIGNAIKYGGAGGWIGIRAAARGREVVVSIADRGMGIGAAEQTHIFEPFYRTPEVIAAQIQGAGLGLSLVHRIVEAHGGRITVRSAPGSGSEFTVHLPAASEQPATRSSAAADTAETSA